MEAQPNGMENKTTPSSLSKIAPIVFEDADKGPSYFSKVGAFLGGCCGKVTTFSKSVLCRTWSWCKVSAQWMWSGLKTIPSFCVIRWNTGNTEDEIDEIMPTKRVANIESVKEEPVKAAIKPGESKTSKVVESPDADKPKFSFASFVSLFSIRALRPSWFKFLSQRAQRTHEGCEEEQYDEDELAPSRWWSIGIKTAAATAAILVLAGGYFAAKPFFNTATEEMTEAEIVEPVNQPHLAQNETSSAVETSALAAPVVAAVPEPAPFGALPLQQQRQPDHTLSAPAPPQGSFLDNDPFFSTQTPPVAPAFADTAPPTGEPFSIAVPNGVVENVPPPALTALPPLSPLEPTHVANTQPQPQLQPLAPLNSSALPATAVAAAPVAVPASTYAPVAANRGQQRTARPAFSDAPIPPAITALPQTALAQPIVVTEPFREIVPQIPYSGTVQNVPPPVSATVLEYQLNEVPHTQSMNTESTNTETAPAIPKDVPVVDTPPIVVVPAAVQRAEFSLPQIASSDVQPIDRQLWEQVELLRNAEAEPPLLRFEAQAETTEPALRFTPRNTVPAHEDNLLAREAANSFGDLMPSPNSNDIAVILPALENAPQPVWAELAPAYRGDTTTNQPSSKGGRTFQNRINTEVTRSPSATETYTIQQGDTYMTISDRFYGTSLLYTALAAHNQQLGIGWRPAEGVVIEIPTAEFLRMRYGGEAMIQQQRLESQRPAVRYIVQEGDTVFRLATDRLQDSTRWREIHAMNADRLQDVRDLKPGMEILLPVETARRN